MSNTIHIVSAMGASLYHCKNTWQYVTIHKYMTIHFFKYLGLISSIYLRILMFFDIGCVFLHLCALFCGIKLLLRNFLQKFSLTADICGLFSLHIMEGWKGLTGHNNLTEKKFIGCSLFQTHRLHLQLKKLLPAQHFFFIRLLSTSITSLMAVTQKMIFPCTS